MPQDPEEEDEINAKPGQDQPHQWVIKRRQAALDTYMYVTELHISFHHYG